jgi:Mrp family chromosome partitioning ATPase
VRIPDLVWLRSGHLQAVFVAASRDADSEIDQFLEWCLTEDVDLITFDTPRGDEFEALRGECIEYLRGKLE